jgi:anti-sigma B factor antagonist
MATTGVRLDPVSVICFVPRVAAGLSERRYVVLPAAPGAARSTSIAWRRPPSTAIRSDALDLAVLSQKEAPQRSGGMGTQDCHIGVQAADDGSAIIAVTGEIDIASSLSFAQRLSAILDEGAAHVIVDLRTTSYLDTTGLSVLWEAAKRCRSENRELAIVCSAGRVRHALSNSGLDQVVVTHATLDEALGRPGATS